MDGVDRADLFPAAHVAHCEGLNRNAGAIDVTFSPQRGSVEHALAIGNHHQIGGFARTDYRW